VCRDYVLTGLASILIYSLITKLALYTSRVYENKHAFTSALTSLSVASPSLSCFLLLISFTIIYASPRVKVYYSPASVSGQINFRVFPVLRNRFLGVFPPKFRKGFSGNHDRFLSFSVFAVFLHFRRFFVGRNQQKLIFANPDAHCVSSSIQCTRACVLISRLVSLVSCRDNKERTKEISSRPSSLGQPFKQYSSLKTRAAGDVSRILVSLRQLLPTIVASRPSNLSTPTGPDRASSTTHSEADQAISGSLGPAKGPASFSAAPSTADVVTRLDH